MPFAPRSQHERGPHSFKTTWESPKTERRENTNTFDAVLRPREGTSALVHQERPQVWRLSLDVSVKPKQPWVLKNETHPTAAGTQCICSLLLAS